MQSPSQISSQCRIIIIITMIIIWSKAKEILKKVKNTNIDIDKLVESAKNSGYNRGYGKRTKIKGLRKEGENGTL